MNRADMTPRRAARLYRLLSAVAKQPRTRKQLMRLCRSHLRTFYRDLETLAACQIVVVLDHGKKHVLVGSLADALGKLPFPADGLKFGDVLNAEAQQKLERQLVRMK